MIPLRYPRPGPQLPCYEYGGRQEERGGYGEGGAIGAGAAVGVQRLVCGWCEMRWNRPRRRGPTPRWCSDACKQAAWRTRVGAEQFAERRRRAEAERVRRLRVAGLHALYRAIDALHPLPTAQARSLLPELAGAERHSTTGPKALYRAAAARWHPDLQDGDEEVFKLLQEAYRIVKLVSA